MSPITKSKFQRLNLLIKMNLRLYIICTAVILSLVGPATADNIATVYGTVYSLDTFEPLNNTVIEVNSIPTQHLVAKNGMYSVDLGPGKYTITAQYYQNNILTYSTKEILDIKEGGNYMFDLLLPPMNSKSGTLSTYLLTAFTLFLVLFGGYQLSQKHKRKVSDKIIDPEVRDEFKVNTEKAISLTELESKVPERKVPAESKEKPRSEENRKTSLEEPVYNPEIGTHTLNEKLPLPTNLQDVIEVIRIEGGQINQKDLRNSLKYSEVKVSLILSDLENRKKIKKVKVGRENIVVLID
jgi:uncharacterized membrane protein